MKRKATLGRHEGQTHLGAPAKRMPLPRDLMTAIPNEILMEAQIPPEGLMSSKPTRRPHESP
jgi:hypothetical protein